MNDRKLYLDLGLLGLFALLVCIVIQILVPGNVSAQPGVAIQPFTYPDISGTSATVKLATTNGCNSIQMLAPSGNMASVRWGDASTSSTRGGVIAAGTGQFLPPSATNYYPLSSLYVYVATGDKLQFVCLR